LLQEKEYRSLGSTKIRHADLRVIAATNASICQAVSEGKFRQDLYYRLNIVPVILPRLSERLEDIPLLALHFLKKYARKFKKNVTAFSDGALHTLMQYPWPGNVRELEHLVERAIVLSQNTIIDIKDLRLSEAVAPHSPRSFQEAKAATLAHFERTYLHALLTVSQGNIAKAARVARKDRRALRQLLQKHQINASRFKLERPS
jgi:two-component system response regulator GlrR